MKAIYEGFLVRGRISIEKIYHKKDVIFGPALVNAAEMEEKFSIYSRVIISKEDLEKGIKIKDDLLDEDERRGFIYNLVKQCEDNKDYYFIDYYEQYIYFLNKVKEIIKNAKEGILSKNVLEKYLDESISKRLIIN